MAEGLRAGGRRRSSRVRMLLCPFRIPCMPILIAVLAWVTSSQAPSVTKEKRALQASQKRIPMRGSVSRHVACRFWYWGIAASARSAATRSSGRFPSSAHYVPACFGRRSCARGIPGRWRYLWTGEAYARMRTRQAPPAMWQASSGWSISRSASQSFEPRHPNDSEHCSPNDVSSLRRGGGA